MRAWRLRNLEAQRAKDRARHYTRPDKQPSVRRARAWTLVCEKLAAILSENGWTWTTMLIVRGLLRHESRQHHRALTLAAQKELRKSQEGRAHLLAKWKRWAKKNTDRVRDIDRKRYAKNPAPKREQAAAWRIANPDLRLAHKHARRAKMVGKYTRDDIAHIRSTQDGCCYYCGCALRREDEVIEHMTPISRGGTNWPDNIALSCARCNGQKGTMTADEFLVWRAKRAA